MTTPCLLVIGSDKTGRKLATRLTPSPLCATAWDYTPQGRRVLSLLRKGRMRPSWILKMAWAEWRRPAMPDRPWPLIRSNADLLELAGRHGAQTVFLFRAGLIVNAKVLEALPRVLNIHCARIPDFGGLGSIPRALKAHAFDQVATLHRVTRRIDEGEVLDTETYRLDPRKSFRENEDIAYEAGIRLLLRSLGEFKG